MKKILLSIAILFALHLTVQAQAPEGFKYQAVVRDGSNMILNNQNVGMQLIIHQGTPGGTAVYTETFSTTSNAYGLVNLEIGTGTTTDNFSAIDWSAGPYFIETAADLTGGTSYTSMGTSQLMSVPYALHAKTAESANVDLVDDADADPTNEYNSSLVLNGTNLELTDGGGLITTDLSPLVSVGGAQWVVSGNDIYNSNTGNIGMGSPTPIRLVEIGSLDTNTVVAIGHRGNFNEAYSGELVFSEDLEHTDFCGIKFQLNGSTNDLHLIGGCATPDTIARFNRSGPSNFQSLRIGDQLLSNPTSTLTVDGNIQVNGNINITGNVSKGGGTFKIDHPLDPKNKYLVHSFVESPEMMNVYSGNITTDANGFATVTMPDYFEAANKDFRYQLTVMGSFAQAIIQKKMENNVFVIQTNQPNIEVSWQVTGVRNDKYANAHRILPVQEKELKGSYIHPELFGADKTLSESEMKDKQAAAEQKTQPAADGQ